jgi:hypothetical protein
MEIWISIATSNPRHGRSSLRLTTGQSGEIDYENKICLYITGLGKKPVANFRTNNALAHRRYSGGLSEWRLTTHASQAGS